MSQPTNVKVKDPEATRTYSIDYADYLAGLGPGVTIATSEWTVPDGITQEGLATNNDTTTSIKLSGGSIRTDYIVYNKITTSDGDSDRRALIIQVRDAATFSEPSEHEARLAAVRVALDKAVAKNAAEYQIANRMKREHSIADLITLESKLTALVNQARQAAALKQGHPFFQNIHTRFLR